MNRRVLNPNKTARLLTGSSFAVAALITFGSSAFGQADAQETKGRQNRDNQSRQSDSSSQQKYQSTIHSPQQGQQTFEGRIVPLYDHLSMKDMSAGIQSSSAGRSSSTTTATPGIGQEGQQGTDRTKEADAKQSWSSQGQLAQPVALIVDTGMHQSRSSTSIQSSDSKEQRNLDRTTPDVNRPDRSTDRSNTDRSTADRSSTDHSAQSKTDGAYASSGMGGHLYVLVFDPNSAQSRSAYQTAQTFAQSYSRMGTGAERSLLTQDRQTSRPGTPGQTTPGQTTPSQTPDRQQVRERENSSVTQPSWGEKVRVTGRVIQSGGLQAIAVEKVERASEPSSKTSTP